MKKFEYLVEIVDITSAEYDETGTYYKHVLSAELLQKSLTSHADDGWRCVNVIVSPVDPEVVTVVLERELPAVLDRTNPVHTS